MLNYKNHILIHNYKIPLENKPTLTLYNVFTLKWLLYQSDINAFTLKKLLYQSDISISIYPF